MEAEVSIRKSMTGMVQAGLPSARPVGVCPAGSVEDGGKARESFVRLLSARR